jgi:hypothetical protein
MEGEAQGVTECSTKRTHCCKKEAQQEREAMIKPAQFGCKKCGGVVTVEMKVWTDHLDFKVKEGKVYDRFGNVEVQCKKCSVAVAQLGLETP